jgi:hypothetical protein
MATIYVRVALKTTSQKFHRCGMAFTREWVKVVDADSATVKRLKEEQMLEVEADQPADYVDPDALTNIPVVPTDPAVRVASIKEAIAKLDKADQALWTGTGMPKVPAIAAVTGWEVTQAERDAVWNEISKG